ncbi:MAG: hypothetical protein JXB20_00500 [Bacilli bacterium]|nr:hypothetical protein [Bacilli bacterium]MBN2697110.1 hypothetical protein [Bacilli bacterium]
MHKSLDAAKKDLAWLKKTNGTKLRRHRSKFSEALEYSLTIDKFTVLSYRIVYYKDPESLSLYYEIIKSGKKKSKTSESHSFHDSVEGKTLPGIKPSDHDDLKGAFSFDLSEGEIKSQIDPLEQAKLFTRVIEENHETLVTYAKSIKTD